MRRTATPPKLFTRLCEWIIAENEKESLPGDFAEAYAGVSASHGAAFALLWYAVQLIKLIPVCCYLNVRWNITMLYNYLKIAVRNLKKHPGYSLINVSGLAIGMTCCFLLLLWVQDELSYDRFHLNADRLYRVIDYEKYTNGEEVVFSMNPPALAPLLLENYPEIVSVARLRTLRGVVMRYGERSFVEKGVTCVDPSLLSMFSYSFVAGDKDNALKDLSSIVITEKMATKYFGGENPLGKVIQIDNRLDYQVSAVIEDLPSNSHQSFSAMLHFENAKEYGMAVEGWGSYAHTTYVLLEEHADFRQVSASIAGLIKEHVPETLVTLGLQPVPDIHLRSHGLWGMGGKGDITYVYIFSIIATFILLLACINFMNLATARAGNRAQEIGLRKVVGAQRRTIALQFFHESMLYSFLALILALILVRLLLPTFNSIAGKSLEFSFRQNLAILGFILVTTVLTGLVAGTYPALYLSAFKPIKVLKGTLSRGSKSSLFRKVLVSFQFVLTIFLMLGTFVVQGQLQFLRNQRLGFDKEQVLTIPLQGDIYEKIDVIKSALQGNPNVMHSTAVSFPPTEIKHSTVLGDWEGRDSDDQFLVYLLCADHDFAAALQIDMVEGRYFSREFPADTASGVVVNERAVAMMGMDSPLGKTVFGDNRIIGVIRDFHFSSLHSPIAPLIIYNAPWDYHSLLVRVRGDDMARTLAAIEKIWSDVATEFPFEYTFLDQQIDEMYRADQRVGKVAYSFSVVAILIACLGLFGLASFTAEQRTKEVGIRKVLGARVTGIVMLLSFEFTRYVLFANGIAWPLAYIVMTQWLKGFAYHIGISWWMFVLTGGAMLLFSLMTVCGQAIRAATANPVITLRHE